MAGEASLSIDAQITKVPFDSLKREARERKGIIESLQQITNKVAKASSESAVPSEAAQKVLEGLLASLDSETTAHEALDKRESANIRRFQARVDVLKVEADRSKKSCIQWNHERLPRLIVDYLLREGLFNSAALLSKEAGCEDLCDWHVFRDAEAIIQSLRSQDCTDAMAWCDGNAARLKRLKSPLLFRLRLQHFLELIKTDAVLPALAYARSHLVPLSQGNFNEFKQALALLVFKRHTSCPRYQPLLLGTRWDALAALFLRELLRINNLPQVPLLELQLQAGLTTLKCPLSYEAGCTKEDPLFQPHMKALAANLPWAKHVTSKVVCAITGRIMDHSNPPLALPNGYVYSKAALEEMAGEQAGRVTCPVTRDTFSFKACVPAYIV